MTYVYVLASGEKDLYLERALLSVVSLGRRNDDARILVLVDDKTADTLTGSRAEIKKYAEIKTVYLPGGLSKHSRSRWLKTTMRQEIIGDFLYIDCDTVIADDLSPAFEINAEIAAVFDQHIPLETHPLKKTFKNSDKKTGFTSFMTDKYFNSGVILCRDTAVCRDFFNEWHRLWKTGVSNNVFLDQPSFNQANINFNNIITELDGIWNCQIEYNGIKYLSNSKIIHYFSSNKGKKPYLLDNPAVFHGIKEAGLVLPEIHEKLDDPRSLFFSQVRLVSDTRMIAIIDSPLSGLLCAKTFNRKNKSLLIDFISSMIFGVLKIRGFVRNFLKNNAGKDI